MLSSAKTEPVKAALLASSRLDGGVFEATAGAALKTFSVEDIAAVSSSCKGQLKTMLLSLLRGGITVELPDRRDANFESGSTPFGPHKVSRFFVHAGKGTVENQVTELLTEAEVKSLKANFNLNDALPKLIELAYFWNSHDKARNRQYAFQGDTTTQQEDFYATGYDFGNDRVAVLFCARLVSRARDLNLDLTKGPEHWANSQAEIFNRFSEGEREILKQLRTGEIRTFSGALGLGSGGTLRAKVYVDFLYRVVPNGERRWYSRAFGSPLSPESKKLGRCDLPPHLVPV